MSNLSGLPPAAIAAAAAKAQIQDIAVRLIRMPDSLQNNPHALSLSGTVKGQTPDGYVQVETERGIINILLKDKGNLPPGQKIEIEIPAGRPPQLAMIHPQTQTQTPTQNQTPHIQLPASSTQTPGTAINANTGVKLERPPILKADDIAEALTSTQTGEIPRASAPLQAGQILRLIPISSMPQTLESLPDIENFSPEILFNSLMKMIDEAIELPLQTRQALTQILGHIDLSTLAPVSGEETATTAQTQIATVFEKLAQSLDLPENFNLQNESSQNITAPTFSSPLANPTKPIDVKILAFQSGNFETALTQAQTPNPNPASPVLVADDFVILPQLIRPSIPGQPTPIPSFLPATQTLPTSKTPELVTPPLVQVQGQGQTPTTQAPVKTPDAASPQPIPTAPPQTVQTPNPNPVATSSPALLGQVTGFTAQGQPIISLALPGSPMPINYAVQFVTNNIIEGAPVIVSPLPTKQAIPTPGIAPFAIGTGQALGEWAQNETWDSFQTLITTIAHLNPAIAQSMTQMLPSPAQPQNIGALSLFFLAMMRSGDLDAWVDAPTIDTLKANNKIDILRQLAGESTLLNRLETTPLPNDWKATILPFWHNGQVEKLPLYYKSWKEDDDQEIDAIRRKKTRFMFELNLSRMGRVQVDGFMKQEKLDMILRTKAPIGPNMQEALRKLYFKAMDRSNLSGEITFQFKPEQWVNMEMARNTI